MRVRVILLAALALMPAASSGGEAFSRRPNVLFIAVDDLRPELGCYGVEGIRSPRIDRLAASGVMFTRAYCQQAVCNPSRASLMTGLRPDSTRVWDLVTHFRDTVPDVVTLPQHFKKHGYTAVAYGKIYHNTLPDRQSWNEPNHWPEKATTWSQASRQRLAAYRAKMRAEGKSEAAVNRMRAPATDDEDVPDGRRPDGEIADQAVEAMRRLAQGEQPFFLAVGFIRPHLPFTPPREYWDLYRRDELALAGNQLVPSDSPPVAMNTMYELRDYLDFADSPPPREGSLAEDEQRRLKHGYYASVSFVDAQIGRLLDTLDELGLGDETIVVVWGDHGWKLGEHNSWCKQTNYEIDTRVPLIIRSPRAKANGASCHVLVEFLDVYPTLCELAGLPLPEHLEGKSLVPLLEKPDRPWAGAAFSQFRRRHEGVDYMGYAMRTDRYRYVEWIDRHSLQTVAAELYDHEHDPQENVSLAARPEHRPLVRQLSDQLWRSLPKPKPLPANRPARRPRLTFHNRLREPVTVWWIPAEGERKLVGKIAPGGQLGQLTTVGHRFAVEGDSSDFRRVVVVDSAGRTVVEVDYAGNREDMSGPAAAPLAVQAPPAELKPGPFYRKYVDADGYPILASARVNDYALKEAAFLVKQMLAHRPDVRRGMVKSGSRMLILAHDEFTTDLPEFAHMEPKDYWDARARGTGGSQTDPYCSCGEENLLGYPGDPYAAECILIHEFAHNIHLRGLLNIDPTFDLRLRAAYEQAMAKGLWKGKYASVNHHEYFAEGVQSWFGNNRPPDHDHNHVDTRAELIAYDPALAEICREVFGQTRLVYTKPATRLEGHLAGYDPGTAPTFRWPERLDDAREAILRKARARSQAEEVRRPNVLFIAVDDLNDWVGCLGGHPQAKTPHIDRLAAAGMLFTGAYCPGASCNPSRTAVMTGIAPHCSGLYSNLQKMRQVLPDAEIMPKYFSRHGYWSAGSGKILHYFIDAPSWDDYFPTKEREDPFPRTLYPDQRPVSLPHEPWMYVETDWGPLEATDEEFGGDWLVTRWIGEQLRRKRDEPFFLACGLYRPHEPWFVPKEYFDLFPLDDVQLPPGVTEGDLDDVPPQGQALGRNRYLDHIRKHGQWKEGVRAYLASIAFADAMVGRVIEALNNSPHRDNTIVVLWSDHGWHLGEKEHWQKFTGWRVCARVPLIICVPKGTPGLPEGVRPGSVCSRPVSLTDLFPTLIDLCGLPRKEGLDGNSLLPLLDDPRAPWPHAALTHLDQPGSYAISTERWRYIHYSRGGEELYDVESDPYEWTNLAGKPEHAKKLTEMRTYAPKDVAPKVAPDAPVALETRSY